MHVAIFLTLMAAAAVSTFHCLILRNSIAQETKTRRAEPTALSSCAGLIHFIRYSHESIQLLQRAMRVHVLKHRTYRTVSSVRTKEDGPMVHFEYL